MVRKIKFRIEYQYARLVLCQTAGRKTNVLSFIASQRCDWLEPWLIWDNGPHESVAAARAFGPHK